MIAFFLFFVGILAVAFSFFFMISLSTWIAVITFFLLFFLVFALFAITVRRFEQELHPTIVRGVLKTYSMIVDFFVQILVMFMLPFAWMRLKSNKGNGTPVVLIHGYFHFGLVFLYLFNKLRKANIGPIYTFNLGSPFHSIEEYANKLHKEFGSFSSLILVGHSLGGLVASYYALHLAKKGQVKKVITIASPFKGTKAAYFALGAAGRQMRPKSNDLKQLSEEVKQSDLCFWHIESKQDQIVSYPSAPNKDDLYLCDRLGHVALLFASKTADTLVSLLKKEDQNV
jgi:triacylglycerol lipase